jgi:hypothetical protein
MLPPPLPLPPEELLDLLAFCRAFAFFFSNP